MPILLDHLDLTTPVAAPKPDPRFFSSKFTGNGKRKSGLLGAQLNPENTSKNTGFIREARQEISKKSSSTHNNIHISSIPMAPITRYALTQAGGSFDLATPHAPGAPFRDRFIVETDSPDWDLSLALTPQGARLYEDTATGDKKLPRQFIVQYRMELYALPKGQDVPERTPIMANTANPWSSPDGFVRVEWEIDPRIAAADFVQELIETLRLTWNNAHELDDWMTGEYVVYDAIDQMVQVWNSEAIADEVVAYIGGIPTSPSTNQLNALALQLRYLENYVIPLESYATINAAIEGRFDAETTSSLAKQNLNLLLSHTLADLGRIKGQLTAPPQPATPPVLPANLSTQQREAITTHEPLVMDNAGAGTGKSTVILSRVQYLIHCGVRPEDVTVVSFTNVAADNIRSKNSDIGSMTMARMIHDIYALNHPTHELSSVDTIINSLDIFHPNSDLAAQLRRHLIDTDQNRPGATTAMNTFIENNFDAVIELLDSIRQTSLELEIIVCYQRIDTMDEPDHVKSRYLIIDEVQDNSIFEFIFVIKYIAKHNQSLFIVGDASQTLFEFRAANPRALNALEGSKVFTTFQLTTNYRSNQEILDFANVVLGNLETNQLANIRLQANSLDVPTADSFTEKVHLDYREAPKITEFVTEQIPLIVANTICREYVDPRLEQGDQIAFLARSRREVSLVEKVLKERYPDRHIANLVSDRPFATDIFSKYIKCFWNDVLVTKPSDAAFVVTQGIQDNMEKLTRNAKNDKVFYAVMNMVQNWWLENAAAIRGWEGLVNQGTLTHDDFFGRLRDNLLKFEIRHNSVRQSLTNQNNRERKESNSSAKADLVVSTIHGAKGMEFDHVVVLHREESPMPQESQRLFYVAFTRAMKSEYVLSHGKLPDPAIVSGHEQIVNALTEREKQAHLQSLGLLDSDDPDEHSDEDADDSAEIPQAV